MFLGKAYSTMFGISETVIIPLLGKITSTVRDNRIYQGELKI
jgi:hypothetical protein